MRSERTIIVVDDEEDARESLALLLRGEGYETRTASDGCEALEKLEALRGAQCILVLDLMMPHMSGFEVLDVLANTRRLPDVPVILCSAIPAPTTLPGGIRRFFVKPVPLDALLRGLEDICNEEPRQRPIGGPDPGAASEIG